MLLKIFVFVLVLATLHPSVIFSDQIFVNGENLMPFHFSNISHSLDDEKSISIKLLDRKLILSNFPHSFTDETLFPVKCRK